MELDDAPLTVRRYAGDTIPADIWAHFFALRARVLRAGQPPGTAHFAGDDLPTTIHLGAFTGEAADTIVGIATLLPEADGIRLRGMAVDTTLQKRGVGAAIVRAAQQIATDAGLDLWCSARVGAVGFYERLGWEVESDPYEVPDIGTHYQMRWQNRYPSSSLSSASSSI